MAQSNKEMSEKGLALVRSNAVALQLSATDIEQLAITKSYTDDISKLTMVYAQQLYSGIPIYNQLLTLSFKDGRLVTKAGVFYRPKKAASTQSARNQQTNNRITASDAAISAARFLKLTVAQTPVGQQAATDTGIYNLGTMGVASEPIKATLRWLPSDSGVLVLVWQVSIAPQGTDDNWLMMVDAASGAILQQQNQTIYCNFGSSPADDNVFAGDAPLPAPAPPVVTTGAQYLVVPFPAESPIHPGGTPATVANPWEQAGINNNATTLGWHSNNTTDYTITRGNNVYAQENHDANNASTGFSPASSTALPQLSFTNIPDFGVMPSASQANVSFAITNLFYWNNIMHDLYYQYGFDEAAGNFQQNNLGRGGYGNDAVLALAQDGAGLNNANFYTPVDGSTPRMRMYLYNNASLAITSPANLAGSYAAGGNSFSNITPGTTTTGNVVLFDNSTATSNQACSQLATGTLAGKIAVIDRGVCAFAAKVKNAQLAGAIGVIVVNNIAGTVGSMGGTIDNTITIPSLIISPEDGNLIKQALLNAQTVSVSMGTPQLDGALDNSIISHEYTHGISNRLTGGGTALAASCLFNAEQMGEGWSDYYALMTTTNWTTASLSDGAQRRTMGTYVSSQRTSGVGIRTYPYSTNMSINPWTYSMLATNTSGEEHSIGEIWCATLWDLTWNIIKQDGNINTNLFNAAAAGGNSVALKLITLGMKLQPCSPGFIDGRDAILKADTILYQGKYSCAIWQAFARRGMGIKASQGSSFSYTDQTADYSLPQIGNFVKTSTATTAAPGDVVEYTIKLKATSCSAINNFTIVDELPVNTSFAGFGSHAGSATYSADTKTITFSSIHISAGDSATFTYRLNINADARTTAVDLLTDEVSDPANTNFTQTVTAGENWRITDASSHSAPYSWFAKNEAFTSTKQLTSAAYLLENPARLSFWHYYNLETGYDFGSLQISTDASGNSWIDAAPYMIQNGYPLQNYTYTGNSGGFVQTVVDLSSFVGQTVRFRFVVSSDESYSAEGWYIDDIALVMPAEINNTARLYDASFSLLSKVSSTIPVSCGVAGVGLLAANTNHAVLNITDSVTVFAAESLCRTIATIKQAGANPVAGNLTANVWVDAEPIYYNGAIFAARHYELIPAINAATATASITLYFTQAEFDAFNNADGVGVATGLPTAANGFIKSNLRIYQYHGTSTSLSGIPSDYEGTTTIINPDDENIVWNSLLQRWEVSFDITGFSGFFLGVQGLTPLPVHIVSFTGQLTSDKKGIALQWMVTTQQNIKNYTIEKSVNGSVFTAIGTVAANELTNTSYRYTDYTLSANEFSNYYRLKINNLDGSVTYSNVINIKSEGYAMIHLSPLPAKNEVILTGSSTALIGTDAVIMDMQGRVVQQTRITNWPLHIKTSHLAAGVYFVKLIDGQLLKMIIER